MRLDQIAIKFYIDPSTNPIRQCARAAYRHGIISQVRVAIQSHSESTRPLSLFDATISTCEWRAQNDKAAQITVARENKARAEKRARRRGEWVEFDSLKAV